MITQEFKDYVSAGVALLDEKFPSWENRVNLEEFSMNSFHSCILGQLYSGYYNGTYRLDLTDEEAALHGFYPGDAWYDSRGDDENGTSADITDYWKSVILQKRAEANVIPSQS